MELIWNKHMDNIHEQWEWESKDPKNRATFLLPLNDDLNIIRELNWL